MSVKGRRWFAALIAASFLGSIGVPARAEEKPEEKKEEKKEEPPKDPKGPGLAGYKKYFHIESADGKFAIDFGARIQFRFTYLDPEEGDSKGSFRVRRAKVYAEGFAYDKDLKFKIQVNASGSSVVLDDAILNWTKVKAASIQIGQYKTPFGVQELTSSGSQQFVDRSTVSEKYAQSRDIGAMLHGRFLDEKLGYQIGIWNGAGVNQSSNDDTKFLTVERFEIMPFGGYSTYESSVKNEGLKMLIGLAAAQNTKGRDADGDGKSDFYDDLSKFEGDVSLRWKRLSFLADYYTQTVEAEDTGAETDSGGLLLQAGFFVIPEHLEIAVRHGVHDPNKDKDKDKETETRLGLNYFIKEHKYKVQLDYGLLDIDKDDVTNKEARVQLQVLF